MPRGLYAHCDLPSGAWLGDFTGVIKPQVSNDGSRYLLEAFYHPALDIHFDVDAQQYGNESRFINDFRGMADEPNVTFMPYRAPTTGEIAIGVVTLHAVKSDEELLVDYGVHFEHAL